MFSVFVSVFLSTKRIVTGSLECIVKQLRQEGLRAHANQLTANYGDLNVQLQIRKALISESPFLQSPCNAVEMALCAVENIRLLHSDRVFIPHVAVAQSASMICGFDIFYALAICNLLHDPCSRLNY